MKKQEIVEKVVRETLSAHFNHIRIQNIDIQEETDIDGDKVLRINVIFLGSPKDLDLEKLNGTVRLLRPKLNEVDDSVFPLLSFITKSDYEARAS